MADKSISITTADLTISEDGRVLINNRALTKAIVDHAKAINPAEAGIFDNCNCGKGGALRAVELGRVLPERSLALNVDFAAIANLGTEGIFDNCSCK